MSTPNTNDLLVVENLTKHFKIGGGFFSGPGATVHAVDDVSFSIKRGQTLSLVGESGCGKTTTGRLIMRLIEPTAGSIRFDGVDLCALGREELRAMRRRIQIVFQDPFSSLNPRMSIRSIIGEALTIHRIGSKSEQVDRVYTLLETVGLPREAAWRYPHEFSGGQRQRIGIARALAVEPELIVADEPVSALDVSVQAQVLNLMKDLQEKLGLTYLFIGHDLSVVRNISDEVAVMYLGKIVEHATEEKIFDAPVHPYTRALLRAVPISNPRARGNRELLEGQVPSPINPPAGCYFHPRCAERQAACKSDRPELAMLAEGHQVACPVCTHTVTR